MKGRLLEVGRPVRDQNERGWDAFRVGVKDQALAVRRDVVGISQRTEIADLE